MYKVLKEASADYRARHQLKTLCFPQYILRTDNLEKVPNTAACRAGSAAPACGPGFFDAVLPAGPAGGGMPLIFSHPPDELGRTANSGQQGGGRGLAAQLSTHSSLADRVVPDGFQNQLGAWLQATVEPVPQVVLQCSARVQLTVLYYAVICTQCREVRRSAVLTHWSTIISAMQEPHPCCDGYFCPPALTCMMPCPLGAYCRR